MYIYVYVYILVFKPYILLKKSYTKHNVSSLPTILSSQNSLNNAYIYMSKKLYYLKDCFVGSNNRGDYFTPGI